jgi:hypothetical protein
VGRHLYRDVSATYDKRDGELHLAASVTAELVAENENPERPGRRRGFVHSGGAI